MNIATQPLFRTVLADTPDLRQAAQSLRYDVFVTELGADGPNVDHARRLEGDAFDDICDHLLLVDGQSGCVAGAYRLIRPEHVADTGTYYSAAEFDLGPLQSSGKRLLELGRSCLRPEYRGGTAMYHLWNALAAYVAEHRIEILFGVASFHGTDPEALAAPLSLLHHRHRAPDAICPKARAPHAASMNRMPEAQIDRLKATRDIPALIKGYLRLGGQVGEGAWIDHAFNTTDVCLVLDTGALNTRQRQIYTRQQ